MSLAVEQTRQIWADEPFVRAYFESESGVIGWIDVTEQKTKFIATFPEKVPEKVPHEFLSQHD